MRNYYAISTSVSRNRESKVYKSFPLLNQVVIIRQAEGAKMTFSIRDAMPADAGIIADFNNRMAEETEARSRMSGVTGETA